jgi:hypothetical protein
MTKKVAKIRVQNVSRPESVRFVDPAMYLAMKRAFLKVLPRTSPGLTAEEIRSRLTAHLPEKLFPGGAGWWAKTVQLDLETKNTIARAKTSPLRWRKT